jgi:uncharacterized protein (DUF2384 family)
MNKLEEYERMDRVVCEARRIWNDLLTSNKWLTTPHPRLNGQEPIRLAAGSREGEQVVMELLHHIEEGAPV